VNASRHRLVARIQEEQQQVPVTWQEKWRNLWSAQQIAPVAFVFVLLLSLFVSGTVVSAAQQALPLRESESDYLFSYCPEPG
jgi:hypothetical protein